MHMFLTLFVGVVFAAIFDTSAAQGDEERTVEISIIVIAALIIFFLLIAWCGFLFGLWRNRKFSKEMTQNNQLRQQQWKARQQQRKQQLQKQQQQPQQQQQQQQNSRPPSQANWVLHSPESHHFSHSRQSSHNSSTSTPSAPQLPLTVPPRDYPDYSPSLNASVSSGISHHNRATFDHLQGYMSPKHSFVNPGYRSTASPQDHILAQSRYSPMPPRSTSTPATKKPHKISQPTTFENSTEMQQYSQLQQWPQNY